MGQYYKRKIEQFSDPTIFKLDIPKPLKAEIISEGQGGKRIAYFDTGKDLFRKFWFGNL
ncbi:MAG: hypothetical protein IPK08_12045 [Bacteroidetes bacterium]|nr:hypothetical protein [Bacteroidota bacterium]